MGLVVGKTGSESPSAIGGRENLDRMLENLTASLTSEDDIGDGPPKSIGLLSYVLAVVTPSFENLVHVITDANLVGRGHDDRD